MIAGEKRYLIVGLGNPGKQYEDTRHNVGFLVVKAFANQLGWEFKEDKAFQAFIAKGRIGDATIYLLLPTTYMNRSGEAVKNVLNFFKLSPEHIFVVVDDVALEYGQMRIRPKGSAGGHNGLKSLEEKLQTQHYVRLRMGIGSPNKETEGSDHLADYVLGQFNREERGQLDAFIERGAQVMMRLVTEQLAPVMNDVNAKQKTRETSPELGQENKHETKKTKPL
jgi:PTH1 family peptidyl-tRNA hydrolase